MVYSTKCCRSDSLSIIQIGSVFRLYCIYSSAIKIEIIRNYSWGFFPVSPSLPVRWTLPRPTKAVTLHASSEVDGALWVHAYMHPAAATWTPALWSAANWGQLSHLVVHLCSGCQGNMETWRHEASDLLPGAPALASRQRTAGSGKQRFILLSVADQHKDDTRVQIAHNPGWRNCKRSKISQCARCWETRVST